MTAPVEFLIDRASTAQIADHLRRCDAEFAPPLSARVAIADYAGKIASRATRFEAWSGDTLVGMAAAYCNDRQGRIAYLTSVSVLRAWTGRGIAARLLRRCLEHAKGAGMRRISLEVARSNAPAVALYEQSGFVADPGDAPVLRMHLCWPDEQADE
jgi:ribosomal protein S18 acetylase RimI-like enzyme